MRRAALAVATLLVGSTLLTFAGCSSHKAKVLPPDEAKRLLIDRNWVDRLPEKIDDKIHVFRFVPNMGGGVYQDRTIFAGAFELFLFSQDGQAIKFDLIHTGEKRLSPFMIEELATPGKEGVDLQLTIAESPRGPSVYYGWRNEGRDLDAHLAQLAHP
jgi:hypothetical protein